MIIEMKDVGTPLAEAMSRLKYSGTSPYMYVADVSDCPSEVMRELSRIDREMALDEGGHAVENWQSIAI